MNKANDSLKVFYTSFKRPATITENGHTAEFTYTASGARAKMVKKQNGSVVSTTYYFADRYEVEVKAGLSHPKERFYMAGTTYTAPVVSIRENGQTDYTTYYICRDYQGSITHITDKNGNKIHEYSYDPWGRLRDPATHTPYAPGTEPALFLGRGYTGHEHLPEFGLINMNARLYDPVLGQFLSPDPYVQAPDNTQNYNRYAYCMNNPLKYTDPSGEIIPFLIIGSTALIGGYQGYKIGKENGASSWGMFVYIAGGAAIGVGAIAGAAVGIAGIGGFAGGAIVGGAAGLSAGFINGLGMSALAGNSFKDALAIGAIGGLVGMGTGALLGGTIEGVRAMKNGCDFWTEKKISTQAPNPQKPEVAQPNSEKSLSSTESQNLTQTQNQNFTVTTAESSEMLSLEGQGIKIGAPSPEIQGHSQSIGAKTDLSHSFPFSFDEIIVNGGDFSFTSRGNYWYVAPGIVNSANGWYSIGMSPNGTIFHRAFFNILSICTLKILMIIV